METPVLDIPRLFEKEAKETSVNLPWNVILHNDDHHTVQDVVLQVQKATGVSMEAAFEITMQAHTHGRTVCYRGTLLDCENVAAILREISLTVDVTQQAAEG